MIECSEKINFGMPALRGQRLTVFNIVTKLYYENSVEATLGEYKVSAQDVADALTYCIVLKCKDDSNRLHFCDGCLLRTNEEGSSFDKSDYEEIGTGSDKFVRSKDGKTFFLGSLQEMADMEAGKETWLIAEKLFRAFFSTGTVL